VIDGDTFVLDSGERVRFADINTPEVNEVGYQAAKDFVISKVEGKTVYLDVDDISGTDSYGRLVCVVYFEYSSAYYENLNKALLDANLAVVYDFSDNEFNPYTWDLYVSKSSVDEFPTVLVLFLLLIPFGLLFIKRKNILKTLRVKNADAHTSFFMLYSAI